MRKGDGVGRDACSNVGLVVKDTAAVQNLVQQRNLAATASKCANCRGYKEWQRQAAGQLVCDVQRDACH